MWLWISGVEIRKKGRVRKVPQPRGVVGHCVNDARDVGNFCEVTVMALMERKEAKQVGGGAVVRHGAFLDPGDGRRVVAKRCEGAFTAVGADCDDVLVTEHAGQFQIGVGDSAVGVGEADQRVLDVAGKGLSPHDRRNGSQQRR